MPTLSTPAHSVTESIDAAMNTTASSLHFPGDTPKYYTTLQFQRFRTNLPVIGGPGNEPLGGATLQTAASVYLPLPLNLVDHHQVKWDEKPVSFTGALRGLAGSFGFGELVDVAIRAPLAMAGLAPNDFWTILFDRPVFKKHKLEFKLSPKTYAEADTIRQIIYTINNAMAPATDSGLGAGLFRFPNIVQVTYKPNNGWTYKFKPAVIESFAVNYAGGEGKKAFYRNESGDGSNPPESVELSLHLWEIEYWINGDFTLENT